MKAKMLILMNRIPWPLKDGGAIGFFNGVKGYHDVGADITVCAINTRKHHVEILPAELTSIANWKYIDLDTEVTWSGALFNLFSGKSYNVQRFDTAAFHRLLQKTLQEQSFNIIVFDSVFMASYLEDVQGSKAFKVMRQHNVEYKIWEGLAAGEKNPLKKAYLSLLARRLKRFEMDAINRVDMISAITQSDTDEFRKMGCTKPIIIIPAGVNLDCLIPSPNSVEPKSVFHLGSMEWLPNREAMNWFLEKVWLRVLEQVPDAKFYLGGRGMPESFQNLKMPNVQVCGEVDDAVEFMNSKQIMIVPLFSGSGIRIKILEGMALGKTIVSTPLGVQGIECDMSNDVLVSGDAEGFAMHLVRLLTDQTECTRIGQNAMKFVRDRYENKQVMGKALSAFMELAKAAS